MEQQKKVGVLHAMADQFFTKEIEVAMMSDLLIYGKVGKIEFNKDLDIVYKSLQDE